MIRVVCFYLISHKRLKVGLEALCAFQIYMLTCYKEAEQPLFEVNFEQLPADKKLGSFATVNEPNCPLNAVLLTASDNFNETNILIAFHLRYQQLNSKVASHVFASLKNRSLHFLAVNVRLTCLGRNGEWLILLIEINLMSYNTKTIASFKIS